MVSSSRGYLESVLVTEGVSDYGMVQWRSLRISTGDGRGVRLR